MLFHSITATMNVDYTDKAVPYAVFSQQILYGLVLSVDLKIFKMTLLLFKQLHRPGYICLDVGPPVEMVNIQYVMTCGRR